LLTVLGPKFRGIFTTARGQKGQQRPSILLCQEKRDHSLLAAEFVLSQVVSQIHAANRQAYALSAHGVRGVQDLEVRLKVGSLRLRI